MSVLVKNITASAQSKMLNELHILEHFSNQYTNELLFISKTIRKDVWNQNNTAQLAHVLKCINDVFGLVSDLMGKNNFFCLDTLCLYIRLLGQYNTFYLMPQPIEYYERFEDNLRLYSASLIIEEQWQCITKSEDGLKCFIEIFDDVFNQCISLHKDKFFHPLAETDILCRAVKDTNCKKERFIPYPTKTNNRWNPPGTQFLYLSFEKDIHQYSEHLTLSEYICLLELRATKGETYSFCDFRAVTPGNILDLSYNDMTLADARHIVEEHYNSTVKEVIGDLLDNPTTVKKLKRAKQEKIKEAVNAAINRHPISRELIEESFAKQYLIMICSCIYIKVDETDETKKEAAYKSFHVLCKYLKSKGITGIIYPCTRSKEIIGKNLVLFNVADATPIESSIREYTYR